MRVEGSVLRTAIAALAIALTASVAATLAWHVGAILKSTAHADVSRLALGLAVALVVPIGWSLHALIAPELASSSFDVRRRLMTSAALVAGALFALLSAASPTRRLPLDLDLVALGTHDPRSHASEVWSFGIARRGVDRIALTPRVTNGDWEPRESVWFSTGDAPRSLRWHGRLTPDMELRLHCHPYSGRVRVQVGRRTRDVDLYCAHETTRHIPLAPFVAGLVEPHPLQFVADAISAAFAWLLVRVTLRRAARRRPDVARSLVLRSTGLVGPDAREHVRSASIAPIVGLCFVGFVFALMTFFPGWMSPDSWDQYEQARRGIYHDWHPVLMAWWWRKLDAVYRGPALMLVQNVLLYWGGFGLFAIAMRRCFGRFAILVPLVGFWPGTLTQLGSIWKDIAFGTTMLFAWALVFRAHSEGRPLRWPARIAVVALAIFGVGVKTNGIIVVPFLFAFLVDVERWFEGRTLRRLFVGAALVIAVGAVASSMVPARQIERRHSFQYQQMHDLLGISVATGDEVLPGYVTDAVARRDVPLASLYSPDSNNALFYGTPGTLRTRDPAKLAELQRRWLDAIRTHPKAYVAHRLRVFASLCRVGYDIASYVANPAIDPNVYGFAFHENRFSRRLVGNVDAHPWMYFPWVYGVALLGALGVLWRFRWQPRFVACFGGSAIAFVAPHLFIGPAADFRYLYYAYLCVGVLAFAALGVLLQRAATRFRAEITALTSGDMREASTAADRLSSARPELSEGTTHEDDERVSG